MTTIARRSFMSLLATVALALSLFGIAPTAFATDPPYILDSGEPASVEIGDTITLTPDNDYWNLNTTGLSAWHVDYKMENATGDTGSATINKHSGVLTPSAAGTVTVRAYLVPISKPSGNNNMPCQTEVFTDTRQVTITSQQTPTYGFQGRSLQIEMDSSLEPDIVSTSTAVDPVTQESYISVYNNTLDTVEADSGYYNFYFSQNYGTGNNFDNFLSYNSGQVYLVDNDASITYTLGSQSSPLILIQNNGSKTNLVVRINDTLIAGHSCTLVFLPDYVAGNNTNKLGATVNFSFTAAD